MPQALNEDAIFPVLANLLEGFEGDKLSPYQDQHGVWTIGYGHTHGVTADTPPITQDEAIEFLKEDMQGAIDSINKFLQVDLNVNQAAALVSIVFNEGTAVLSGHLGWYINQGNFTAAAAEFDKWVYITINGEKVKSNGLIKRRDAEKVLFMTPA